MIHGGSTDPVFVKKIALRIWRLRDEIEAVVKDRFSDPNNIPSLTDLIKEYQETGDIVGDSEGEEGVKDASELDDFGEDEMAKALAAAEAGEDEDSGEEAEQEAGEAEGGEQSQDDIDALLESGGEIPETSTEQEVIKSEVEPAVENGKTLLKQRRPRIPESSMYSGRAILSEIYMNEMYFFSNEQFLEGQSIVIDFLVPRRFLMNAVVRYCRTYNMKSRIISKNKHPYRVCVQFSYLKPGERTILRNFVESIEPAVEEITVPEKKEEESGDGDDFDIFDDLE